MIKQHKKIALREEKVLFLCFNDRINLPYFKNMFDPQQEEIISKKLLRRQFISL